MPWVMGIPNAHEMRLSVQADFMESSGVYANGDHLLSQNDLNRIEGVGGYKSWRVFRPLILTYGSQRQ